MSAAVAVVTTAQAWHIFIGGLLGGFVLGALFSIAVYHHALEKAEIALRHKTTLLVKAWHDLDVALAKLQRLRHASRAEAPRILRELKLEGWDTVGGTPPDEPRPA